MRRKSKESVALMEVYGEEVAKRFRCIIANRGWTIEKAGKKLGMTKQGVSYALLNRKVWKEADVDYWCKCLNVDKERICNGNK